MWYDLRTSVCFGIEPASSKTLLARIILRCHRRDLEQTLLHRMRELQSQRKTYISLRIDSCTAPSCGRSGRYQALMSMCNEFAQAHRAPYLCTRLRTLPLDRRAQAMR